MDERRSGLPPLPGCVGHASSLCVLLYNGTNDECHARSRYRIEAIRGLDIELADGSKLRSAYRAKEVKGRCSRSL